MSRSPALKERTAPNWRNASDVQWIERRKYPIAPLVDIQFSPYALLAKELQEEQDGLAGDMRAWLDTLERIAAFARSEPTVLLPSHDSLAGDRLAERQAALLRPAADRNLVCRRYIRVHLACPPDGARAPQ
jgi:hypothetical protein